MQMFAAVDLNWHLETNEEETSLSNTFTPPRNDERREGNGGICQRKQGRFAILPTRHKVLRS